MASTFAICLVALVGACQGPSPSDTPLDTFIPAPTPTPLSDVPAYQLDCGPEFSPDCERNAARIAGDLPQEHPGRYVVKVLLTDRRGGYVATLDDLTILPGRTQEQ